MEKEPLDLILRDLKRQVQQHKVSIFDAICFHLENKLCICVLRTYTCMAYPDKKELKLQMRKG